MSTYLTSALAKLCHQEAGSAFVEAILATNQPVFVSRLGVVEMHSVLSGKVRARILTQAVTAGCERLREEVRQLKEILTRHNLLVPFPTPEPQEHSSGLFHRQNDGLVPQSHPVLCGAR